MVGFTNNIQFSGAPLSDSADQQATASADVNFTDSNNFLSATGTASLDTGGGAFNYNGGFTVTRSTINGDLAYTFSTNDPSGNALSFSVDTNTSNQVLNLSGVYGADPYAANGPTPATITAVGGLCFCAGTRIAIPDGDRPVEQLKVGDVVLTSSGEARPVVWIGRRAIEFSCGDYEALRPYRVCAGAFGEATPSRDLWLSPDHAVAVTCLSQVLIPIKHLDNGATIAEVAVDAVEYWHVELDRHDLLLAENMAAESFLDTRGRGFFDSASALAAQTARAPFRTVKDFCRPLVTEGPIIDAVRLQPLVRARRLGWTLTDDADLHAVIDGVAIRPEITDAVRFALPLGASDVRLVSRSFTPRHTDVTTFDDRRLDVAVRAIRVTDGEGRERSVSLDDPGLSSGFHPAQAWEGDRWRWTDGDAVLSSALWAGSPRPVTLTLQLAPERGSLRAWLPPTDSAAADPQQRLASAA